MFMPFLLFLKEGEACMYYLLKVLNNNALIARVREDGSERILLGKGIGFGRKTGEEFEEIEGASVYTPVVRETQSSAMSAVNAIDPVYLEAAGKIIQEAEQVFDTIRRDILLPLADHIAFAAKREKEKIFLANPFIPDIKILFGKEYAVALKSREIIEKMTGYRISDDEAGFIALHIHSGLSGEQVSDTLKTTQIIDDCITMLEEYLGDKIYKESLSYIRLMSHLYYMVIRARTGEAVNIELNEFVRKQYPKAGDISELICHYMEKRLEKRLDREEIGFLAIHIQRIL